MGRLFHKNCMVDRPDNEEEFQKREAVGVIRASRFVRKYAHSHNPITVQVVCDIHSQIFKDAWGEIAGKYREENLTISDSDLLLPHHSEVQSRMDAIESELQELLQTIENAEGVIASVNYNIDLANESIDRVVRIASWLHHQITFVHPFREGNGRTARLAANLILERYGLVGISIKVEKENKNRYRQALVQIDKHQDFEPLVALMLDGLLERYNGVAVRYYDFQKNSKLK